MHRNSEFTFTKRMVAIAVLALLTSLATPSFLTWLTNYRLQCGAEEVQSTLQLTRMTAIKKNTSSTVSFDIANESFQASVGDQIICKGRMPAGINIFSAKFGHGTFVQFDSQGHTINNTHGSANLVNRIGEAKTITVFSTGNSQIN